MEQEGAARQDHSLLQAWLAELDDTTGWLWSAFGAPLSTSLSKSGIESVTLVPMGLLGLLPLHAAWAEDASAESGRRYLLDEFCVSYAPNAQSLNAARADLRRRADSILAIDEPGPMPNARLAGSAQEVEAAVASFPGEGTILRHSEATRANVLGSLANHDVIHLSCHAIAHPDRPLESAVLMADEPITLADLVESRLEGTRLVVLSACETAFPGTGLLDEVVSLPTGLLQAGAAAIIGSLWPVEDLATMVLLTRFYQLWRDENMTPPEALRGAQRWVRDLTHDRRAAAFPEVDFGESGSPSSRPYASPFWWAAFGLTGA